VGLLWAQHKASGAFKAIVAQEFERALADLSAEVMQNEAEVPALLSDQSVCLSNKVCKLRAHC